MGGLEGTQAATSCLGSIIQKPRDCVDQLNIPKHLVYLASGWYVLLIGRAGTWIQKHKIQKVPNPTFFSSFFFTFLRYFFIFILSGWVKIKLKHPHFHVSDTCRVSI